MSENRFHYQREDDETWSVVDSMTNRVAEVGSRQVSGLNKDDAMDLLETLNAPGPIPYAEARP
jgi:hypothetical protein